MTRSPSFSYAPSSVDSPVVMADLRKKKRGVFFPNNKKSLLALAVRASPPSCRSAAPATRRRRETVYRIDLTLPQDTAVRASTTSTCSGSSTPCRLPSALSAQGRSSVAQRAAAARDRPRKARSASSPSPG